MKTHIRRLVRNVHAVSRPSEKGDVMAALAGALMHSIQLSLFGDSGALSLQVPFFASWNALLVSRSSETSLACLVGLRKHGMPSGAPCARHPDCRAEAKTKQESSLLPCLSTTCPSFARRSCLFLQHGQGESVHAPQDDTSKVFLCEIKSLGKIERVERAGGRA